MSRPLPLVIDAIVKQIPADFADREELLDKIERTKQSALYAAPEIMSTHWMALGSHLQDHLGDATDGWKQTVEDIMTAKADYKDFLK